MYHFEWALFWRYVWPPTAFQNPQVLNGILVTLAVSVIAQAVGVILGLFAALGKMSKFPLFRWIADIYIWYFRGTPLLVQMVFFFFGLGVTHIMDFPDITVLGIKIIGAVQAGTLALAVNEGAYMAEIVRAGIESIDPGQMEAAKSLGMTYAQAMRRIVLPQATKVIIPPLGNEFNNMMKTTSLLEVISAGDLFFAFNQINANLFKPFELYLALSFYYLELTTIWSFIQSRIEAGLGERKAREKSPTMFQRLFEGRGVH